jgi:NAD(P)-dependent dehydrogenase (short-subunit alcohol dehydrogenase family)
MDPACGVRQHRCGFAGTPATDPDVSGLLTGVDRNGFDRLFDMSDRTVIVTGGTRGIGLALAEGFVLAGARVAVASRKADACEAAAGHLRSLGGQAIGVPTHVGDPDDLGALVSATVAEFGGVDVVVNNAANALAQPLGQMTPEAWAKSYSVNLQGPVFLVQHALPHLTQSSSSAVLNMVSVGAFNFAPSLAIYASSKAALMSVTRSMAAELAPSGVRVNAIAPGPVDTDMMRNNPQAAIDAMTAGTLMRRLAAPDEMVGAALLLCSDAGSYMTGQVVIVDGGGTPR